MPLVEQELVIFPEQTSSPQVVRGIRVARSLVFRAVLCRLLFLLFLLPIVLCVLWFTPCDYPFGIFNFVWYIIKNVAIYSDYTCLLVHKDVLDRRYIHISVMIHLSHILSNFKEVTITIICRVWDICILDYLYILKATSFSMSISYQ